MSHKHINHAPIINNETGRTVLTAQALIAGSTLGHLLTTIRTTSKTLSEPLNTTSSKSNPKGIIMKGSKFLLAAIAEKLVAAYKSQIEEYQTLGAKPLELGISDTAPSTYEALCEEAKQGKLTVTTEFSKSAIYGIAGNVTFRIFHDFGHLIYNKEFTTRDEVDLAKTQWHDIKLRIEPEWRELANVVYTADTVLQSQYEAEHGKFPEDQKAFVLERLNNYLMLKDHYKL